MLVEAAGIEPPRESDTFATLLERNHGKTRTPEEVRNRFLDIFRADSEQNGDSFLRSVYEICVK
jgi:hypothetical protein